MTGRIHERPAWRALAAHHGAIGERLRELFAEDPRRGDRLVLDAAGLHLDYSKNRVSDETIRLLIERAREYRVRERVGAELTREAEPALEHDSSTNALIRRYRHLRDAGGAG